MKNTGPDSFNSWLNAFGCTFISMVLYAEVRLSGLLLVSSMPRFQVDRQRASQPYMFCDFIEAILSPVTGFLAYKFGIRPVMIFGCFLSAVGIGSCFLAEEITTVTALWGVVFGLGYGLTYPLLTIVITQHFVAKRATAVGVMCLGAYGGLSIITITTEYLIGIYGLSGAFLYLSGFTLNCVPVAMLLKKPNFAIDKLKMVVSKETMISNETFPRNLSSSMCASSKESDGGLYMDIIPNSSFRKRQFPTIEKDSEGRSDNNLQIENCKEFEILNTKSVSNAVEVNSKNEMRNKEMKEGKTVELKSEPYICHKAAVLPKQSDIYLGSYKDSNETHKNISSYDRVTANEIAYNRSPSSTSSKNKKSNLTEKDSIVSSAVLTQNIYQSEKFTKPSGAYKVFLEPIFLLVLLAIAVYDCGIVAFLTIVLDFSRDFGLPLTHGNYIIIGYSVASNIGVVSFGWVTDNGYLTLTNFSGILLLCRGITSALIPFSNSFLVLMIVVVLQGLCEAPLGNLFPLIIAEYYAEDIHEFAISCRFFFCAPVYLVIPTLIGYFRDGLGSYFYLFISISMLSLVCSIALFLAPVLAKCRCGRDETILRSKCPQPQGPDLKLKC